MHIFKRNWLLAEAVVSIKLCSGVPNQVAGASRGWQLAWQAWCVDVHFVIKMGEARPPLGLPEFCCSASVNPGIGLLPWLIFVTIHLVRNCVKWNSAYSFESLLKLYSRDITVAKIDRAIFLLADIKLVQICLAAILLFPKTLGIV